MKKALLFVLTVSLLVAACTDSGEEALAPQEVRDLPVFALGENSVQPEQLAELLKILEVDAELSNPDTTAPVSFVDTNTFMALPSKVVAKGKSAEGEGATTVEAFDLATIQKTKPTPADEALERALNALDKVQLAPESENVGAEPSVVYSTFEALQKDGETLAKVDMDAHVLFDLSLKTGRSSVPLMGPGAKVKMVFNPDGDITQLYYGLYRLEQVGTTSVMSRQAAAEACAATYAESSVKPDAVTAELVYYVPNVQGKKPGSVQVAPSYQCNVAAESEGEELALRRTLIDATDGRSLETGELEVASRQAQSSAALSTQSVGRVDVGVEYVGTSQGLSGSQGNANGFRDTISSKGIPVQFTYGDFSAWEQDFKDPSNGGDDSSYVDDVDMVFYTGHANGNGFTFPGNNDDGFLHYDDARWGNRDLEWLVIAACGPLQVNSGGQDYVQRWGSAFNGLHQMLAYANVSYDNTDEGRLMAEKLMGTQVLWFDVGVKRVRTAWVETATQVQPSSVTWAVMGPYGSGYTSNYNDYFWGKGATTADIDNPIAYWRISGPS